MQKPSPKKRALNPKNVNKLPAWARTADQDDLDMDAEVQELLNFTSTLDYDDVVNDIEVKAALKNLKDKVEDIKRADQEAQRAKDRERERQQAQVRQRESDVKGNTLQLDGGDNNLQELRSVRSEGQKSIAESRAEERLEELQHKVDVTGKKEFETSSRMGDNVAADD